MNADHVEFPGKHNRDEMNPDDTQKLPVLRRTGTTGTLEKASFPMFSFNSASEDVKAMGESQVEADEAGDEQAEMLLTEEENVVTEEKPLEEETADKSIDEEITAPLPGNMLIEDNDRVSAINVAVDGPDETKEAKTTLDQPLLSVAGDNSPRFVHSPRQQKPIISRGRAILFVAFLVILILNAVNLGSTQFLGPQGWAYVLGGPTTNSNQNPLDIVKRLIQKTPVVGATVQAHMTAAQYIDLLVKNMTLDQKLGQMMIVQFVGPSYSLDISTMISQYNVGAVLIFAANNNIQSKPQLKGLIQQMQHSSAIPMTVAIDQEGGTVDRLINLDGPRPSATSIGATNNPINAYNEGVRDANDLSYYGINLNLAPVVDVNNVYNPQMYLRTFGNNPTTVTQMAEAYLKGLQKSGKVLGTLKHFPGLGDVTTDPHSGVPHLDRSESDLMKIDWAPYKAMIQQGNVYSVMVTHEIVQAVDSSIPSSLSYKVVTGILRNQLGFQGVIMTDSLTMEGILAYYTESEAAALAVEAGDDVLMGATTPSDVAAMVTGLKQAVTSGQISEQRIDDSVRRILTLKYQMGLLHIPTI